jgi:hypothetical protein
MMTGQRQALFSAELENNRVHFAPSCNAVNSYGSSSMKHAFNGDISIQFPRGGVVTVDGTAFADDVFHGGKPGSSKALRFRFVAVSVVA